MKEKEKTFEVRENAKNFIKCTMFGIIEEICCIFKCIKSNVQIGNSQFAHNIYYCAL